MTKRSAAAILWGLALWNAGAKAQFFLGLPGDGGIVLGLLGAAVVLADPLGWLTPRRAPGAPVRTTPAEGGNAPEPAR